MRQPFLQEIQSQDIAAAIGQLGDAVVEAEHEKDRRVVAHRDAGIAAFDPVERGPADECALGQGDRADAATKAGVADVRAELAEEAQDREGDGGLDGCCHVCVLENVR